MCKRQNQSGTKTFRRLETVSNGNQDFLVLTRATGVRGRGGLCQVAVKVTEADSNETSSFLNDKTHSYDRSNLDGGTKYTLKNLRQSCGSRIFRWNKHFSKQDAEY